MSGCARGGRIAYEKPGGQRSFSSSKKTGEENGVLELRIDFEGECQPWTYPLALNGREVAGVHVGGARYERVDGARIAELESLVRDMHVKMDRMARIADGALDSISFTAEWELFGERMAEMGIEEERW